MPMRVVTNQARHTAIAVREGHKLVHYIVMESASLRMRSLPKATFDSAWHAMDYPIERAVERFRAHAEKKGASKEVMEALAPMPGQTVAPTVEPPVIVPPSSDVGGQMRLVP